jgi:hypothetical protein
MPVTLSAGNVALLVLAGLGAGVVNGAAGGGTLVSFPALLVVGYPAITANVTSTVGIWPGYLGGTAGFRSEVSDQWDRLRSLAATVILGAVVGGVLLLTTPSDDFRRLAPYLLLFSCALFAVQSLLSRRIRSHPDAVERTHGLVLHSGCSWLPSMAPISEPDLVSYLSPSSDSTSRSRSTESTGCGACWL